MTGFFMLGWHITVKELTEKPAEYNRLIEEAKHYEEEKIYIRAIDSYKEALKYNPNSLDIQMKIASNYLALGDETSFVNRCNSINESQGYPVSAVIMLADYYTGSGRNERAITLLHNAMKKNKNNEELESRYEKLRYTYKEVYVSYDEIFSFRNDSAVYVEEGHYGLLNSSGNVIVRNYNDWNGALSGTRDAVPVYREGGFYFADENGYRIEVPSKEQKVEELGVLCNDAAPAKINGKYGYINRKFEELSPFAWDGATVIQTGFGAVKQGEKWALINESYNMITDFIFDDVKTDEYGYCSISGRAFMKRGTDYEMVNEKGEIIGECRYEDAVPFVSEEPTAVKQHGQWGFVDVNGEVIIAPQYKNAGAFNGGLAPVETDGGWGYIDLDNNLVIAADFTDARSFYKGIAPVKKGNRWSMIQLNVK